jgi:hypothetical protein
VPKHKGDITMTDAIDSRLIKVPSDVEAYSPVDVDSDSIVITDGNTDWKLMAINDDNICSLVPVNEAKDPDGRTVRLVELSVLQAIAAKPFVLSAETPDNDFWTKYHFSLVPDFKPETVAEYKAKTDAIVFQIGQTYELQDEFGIHPYTVSYRLEDMLQVKDKFGVITIRNIHVDDNGEFIRPNLDSQRLYAAGTPSWFYPVDRPDFNVLEETRARMRADLDSDRSANFELSRGGLI